MDNQDLHSQIHLGKKAENFLTGELGKYIIDRAQDQSEAAIIKLVSVDPNDTDKIQYLQNEIRVTRMAIEWLSDLIVMGAQNLKLIEEGIEDS